MAIATELQRIIDAKADIKASIEAKGVSVPSNATIDDYSQYVDAISGGGGGEDERDPNPVKLYGWDGEVAYSYTAAEFLALEALPANPTHSGFTSQGWNWTLADAKAYVTEHGALNIGQMYVTSDGVTRVYIDTSLIPKPTREFTLYFRQNKSNGVTIDWGDGSAAVTVSGTSGDKTASHSYSEVGEYVISITPDSDCNITRLGQNTTSYGSIFGYMRNSRLHASLDAVTKVELGARVLGVGILGGINLRSFNLPSGTTNFIIHQYIAIKHITLPDTVTILYVFEPSVSSLKSLSLANGITTISGSTFRSCNNLRSVTIPSSVTSIGTYAFSDDYSMVTLTLGSSLSTIDSYAFSNCRSLRKITFPNTVTSIGGNSFTNGYSIDQDVLDIPNSCTTIGGNAFTNIFISVKRINIGTGITNIGTDAFGGSQENESVLESICIYATTPPTIVANTFRNTWNCPIYVPDASVAAYKSASIWSTLASRIFPLSDLVE